MPNFKLDRIKQLSSKFKVSYFFGFLLFLSLSSCTQRDKDNLRLFVVSILYALPCFIIIGGLFYFIGFGLYFNSVNWYNQERSTGLGEKNIGKFIPITSKYKIELESLPIVRYFILGLIPLFVFSGIIVHLRTRYIHADQDMTKYLIIVVVFFIFIHIKNTIKLCEINSRSTSLIIKRTRMTLKPKELLNMLRGEQVFSDYNIEAVKNELVLRPKKKGLERVVVIQCASRVEEDYNYVVEGAFHTLASIGFAENNELINDIINLENK